MHALVLQQLAHYVGSFVEPTWQISHDAHLIVFFSAGDGAAALALLLLLRLLLLRTLTFISFLALLRPLLALLLRRLRLRLFLRPLEQGLS